MAAGNELTVVGNVTRDPELRFTPNGHAVANFAVAWNKRFQTSDGEWDSTPHFIDVTVWRELAENCVESLRKGDRVVVMGHFEQETWEDKDSGQNRSRVVLVADEVGPSLRWATTPEVVKNERQEREPQGRGGGRGGGGRGRGDGGRSSGGDSGRGRGRSSGRSEPAPAPGFDDDPEEPFLADAGTWSPTMGFGSYPERMLD